MSSLTMRFLAEPSTVNFGGKVHGGTVMKWIDEASLRLRIALGQALLRQGIGGQHPLSASHHDW